MKKTLSLVVAILLCATLFPLPAFAAPISKYDSISTRVPYFPFLEIRMTNAPSYAVDMEWETGLHQIKFYYNSDTTIGFDRDMKMTSSSGGTWEIPEGGALPASLLEGGSLNIDIIAHSDGTFSMSNSNSHNIELGETVYMLSFVDVVYYEKNIAEGNTFADINGWATQQAPAATEPATEEATEATEPPAPVKRALLERKYVYTEEAE